MSYTSKSVFTNRSLNSVIDLFMYHLDRIAKDRALALDINNFFALSGKAAAILQEEDYAVDQIIFVVSNHNLNFILKNDISDIIPNNGFVNMEDRCIYYFQDFIIEFWIVDDVFPITVDTIVVQELSEIPIKFL